MPDPFPMPADDDPEDVTWALSTGFALWKRGERGDALVWLERGIDAAVGVGRAARAEELRAKVRELLHVESVPPPPPAPPAMVKAPSPPPPPPRRGPPPPPPAAKTRPAAPPPPPHGGATSRAALPPPLPPPASPAMHPPPLMASPLPPPPVGSQDGKSASTPAAGAARAAPSSGPERKSDPALSTEPGRERDSASKLLAMVEAVLANNPSARPPVEPDGEKLVEAVASSMRPPAPSPPRSSAAPAASSKTASRRPSARPPTDDDVLESATTGVRPAYPPAPAASRPSPASARTIATASAPEFSIAGVPLLEALSDGQALEVTKLAQIVTLEAGQPLSEYGLVLVLEGTASVAVRADPERATRVQAGDLVYAKGSVSDAPTLTVLGGAPSVRLAVWKDDEVDRMLGRCPGLLDELREASDRLQALAGSALGPLGERLDHGLRALTVERLQARALEPREILAKQGEPLAGLVVVGVGGLEILRDGEVVQHLRPGDILFPDVVLRNGNAPGEARAGQTGCVVLYGPRKLAHELVVTCPPLLELLSGM